MDEKEGSKCESKFLTFQHYVILIR